MLTFSFTGADGSMTECEVLTSGMVGKEILFEFDQSWKDLTKTLVFRAGEITRVVPFAAENTIPADVLKQPFCMLYVGAYGTDAEGTLVIPSVMAEGPMIEYGADPIEDETAAELPVWRNLQNQIGDPVFLETAEKANLVAAINNLHRRLSTVEQNSAEPLSAFWDFRTGSLTDQVAGLEATATADVVLDTSGAHTASSTSCITVPLGIGGASLAGNCIEIKFGTMTLVDTGTTMRLVTGNGGKQPATSGLMWTGQDCWSYKLSVVTEFTDLQMFSGKTLIGKPNADATQILWYLENQCLGPSDPGYVPTHVSIGCSANGAYPVTVEHIKIRPLT